MSISLTPTLRNLSRQTVKRPQIILEIDGIPYIFGALPVLTQWRFDQGFKFDTPGLFFDQGFEDPNSKDYISLEGSKRSITQQVFPDKSGTSSTSTSTINLTDTNADVTDIFKQGNFVDDILGRDASLYYSLQGAIHPVDSIPLLNGYINEHLLPPASVKIGISHPENLKRKKLFVPYSAENTSSMIYKDLLVQDLYYEQRDKGEAVLSIEYIAGSGDASFNRSQNKITVPVDGATKASDVVDKIEEIAQIVNVVKVRVVGDPDNIQVVQTETQFTIDTVIQVPSTLNLLPTQDNVKTWVRMDDEIMEVVSFDSVSITVNRAALGTLGKTHDTEQAVESIYQINDDPITMALKMYMSDRDRTPFGNYDIVSINQVNDTIFVQNSINLGQNDAVREHGIVEGDFAVVSGTSSDGEYEILDIVNTDVEQYLVLDGALTTEVAATGSVQFVSQFNVYPDGVGLTGREVDVQEHIDTLDENPSTFPEYEFLLEEEVDGKEFIDRELYYPVSVYSIPRKARISLKLVKPPLSTSELISLDESNIIKPETIQSKRSTYKYLYNSILFKYEKNISNGRYLAGDLYTNESSFNRIGKGKISNQLLVKSDGLRRSAETSNLISRQVQRLFDRYKFAAQEIQNVQVGIEHGLPIEVGDIISFGSDTLPLSDLNTGERIFKARLVEVVNKKFDLFSGISTLSLIESSYQIDARYGVISLGSKVGAGSTNNEIVIKTSFGSESDYDTESDKWAPFANQRIRVRSDDYDKDEVVTLLGVKPSNQSVLQVTPALSFVPDEDYVVESPEYSDTSGEDDIYKDQFVFSGAQPEITVSVDESSFEVDRPLDIPEGSKIYVHSDYYDRDSFDEEVEVVDVTGSVITLDKPLSFTPQVGDKVEKANFKDDGFPYLIF